MCTCPRVKGFDFLGGLAARLVFENALPGGQGMDKGHALPEMHGRDLEPVSGDRLGGFIGQRPARRHGVKHGGGGRLGKGADIGGGGDRAQIEDAGATGDQHQ